MVAIVREDTRLQMSLVFGLAKGPKIACANIAQHRPRCSGKRKRFIFSIRQKNRGLTPVREAYQVIDKGQVGGPEKRGSVARFKI
jgi:hypothetical protein